MENIKKVETSSIIEKNMMEYSLSVLTSRALPELVDGLKPAHRKFLYTMNNMHLFNQRAKSANIVGQVMKVNPHGESYGTGVRLTRQAEVLLCPFIIGKGSFGKVYSSSMEPAACFTGDTRILLAEGGDIDIKSLVEKFNNTEEDLYVYSASTKDGSIHKGKIINAKCNGKKEIIKITLDNGEEIRCTKNHPFLLRTGKYIHAEDLKEGDSLMPLYTRIINNSLEVYDNNSCSYIPSYRIDLENIWGYNEFNNISCEKYKQNCVHHLDFNHLNNKLSNLIYIPWDIHGAIHSYCQSIRDMNCEKGRTNIRNKFYKRASNIEKEKIDLVCDYIFNWYDSLSEEEKTEFDSRLHNDAVRRGKNGAKKLLETYGTEHYKKMSEKGGWKKWRENNTELAREISKENHKIRAAAANKPGVKARGRIRNYYGKVVELYGEFNKENYLEFIKKEKPYNAFSWEKLFKYYKDINEIKQDYEARYNHKVLKVEALKTEELIYDIEVEKYHNFALKAGVFVHNSRYTEMQLEPICHEFFDNLKKNPDNLIDNFDGTMKEPRYLSMPFPNILANPNMGIAVGFACNFPSFNLNELCDASIETIKNYDLDNKKLLPIILKAMPTADFTTGGEILIDKEQLKSIYETGQGSITIRAVFNDDSKNRILEIIEIPYTTTAENVVDSIIKAYKENRLPEITDVRDEIDKNGFKVAVDYKRGTDVEELKKKLLSLTPLEDNFNCNFNLVYQNTPQQMGVIDILKNWVQHRREWVEIELKYDLKEKEELLHLLKGLEKALLDLDKAVEIVRKSANDEEVIKGLKEEFKVDDLQAEFIAEIKLRNFNKDYILNKTKEINKLKEEIKDLKKTIESGIDTKLISDLERIKKKYGIPRKSKIITEWEELPTFRKNAKPELKVEGNSIMFFNGDIVKRVPDTSSAKTPNGFTKYNIPNTSEALIFTNMGRTFKWNINKIPEGSNQKFSEIKQIIKKLEMGETIIYSCPLIPENKIVVIYDNNKISKFSASLFETTGTKLLFKKGVNIKSPIEYIKMIEKDKEIDLDKYKGVINTADYPEMNSRTAGGRKLKNKLNK